MRYRMIATALAAFLLLSCGGGKSPNPNAPDPIAPAPPPGTPAPTPTPPPLVRVADYVLITAGDIGLCGSDGASRTGGLIGRLLAKYQKGDTRAGLVPNGDLAYPNGTAQNYLDCFNPHWGGYMNIMWPVLGNHEYDSSPTAAPYFNYFRDRAGSDRLGYSSVQLGAWRVFFLNSEIITDPLIARDPAKGAVQLAWLSSELQAYASFGGCQIAFWHKPLYSDSVNGDNPQVKVFWDLMYRYHVEAVVNGHDHVYQRFLPQTPEGIATPDGIREFVVGTGGGELYQFRPTARSTSKVRLSGRFGLLALILSDGSYDWKFVDTSGDQELDSFNPKEETAVCDPVTSR